MIKMDNTVEDTFHFNFLHVVEEKHDYTVFVVALQLKIMHL